jgi:hypothetical protein
MIPERIGGWGRLAVVVGVVLSIVWSGAMLYRGSEQMRVQRLAFADEAKKSCEASSEKDCSGAWIRAYFEAQKRQDDLPDLLKPGAFEAFIPVLIAWLTAYGIVSAVRWVAEGFKQERDQREQAGQPHRGHRGTAGNGLGKGDGATTLIAAMIRIVHNAAVTLLIASGGFMMAAFVAHHTGFGSWSDGLANTYLWNFALAVALYGLVAVLLAGQGVVRLIGTRRQVQP